MSKKALLVGINRYAIPGADLRGCVNDVINLKGVLLKYYGFPKGNIKTLMDLQATKKNIQAGIEKLVRGAKRGDVLVIHYSGHGSNVPDKNGDEADHRDEIMCPTDLDWKDPLLDDWLRSTFNGLPSGVSLTVIMDSCHSGSVTRAIEPPDVKIKERYLPSPWDLVAVESGRSLRGTTRGTLRSRASVAGGSDTVDVNIPELLISGCRDTQTSADAFIKGTYNGALTYHLVAAINEKKGIITYGDLHARTIALLKGRYDQVPQLEGQAARFKQPFLSPAERCG
jgi:hypothetical protein